jgi:FKBP-type peptidyl-prolyl cis-trans isomerase FklB
MRLSPLLLSSLLSIALVVPVAASNAAGKKFLEENAKKDGVISLPSGLQYKVLRAGDGQFHPTADSSCECHYEGRTAQDYPNGETFDSSYARGSPTSFAPNQVIKGWTEAMQMMVEGDKWEMYIPSELGYGESGSPPKIGGGDVLVFTMEIIKIKGDKKPANKCDVKTYEGCTEKETTYLKAKAELSKDAIAAELKRLNGMKSGKMSAVAASWLSTRVLLLGKLKDEL